MCPSSHPHLYFKPYELFLQPTEASEPVKAHGELYTSAAFIEAHHDLQESPREPGCDLQRVVAGLMFASDGTQLTAFSTTKLWPIYLAMENESKDRRTKPSCRAFEHITYLETVRRISFSFALVCDPHSFLNDSSQMHLKHSPQSICVEKAQAVYS